MTAFPSFNRDRPQNIALIFLGAAFASLAYHFYLWGCFMRTQHRVPNAGLGLVYGMNNHGWVYYLSATQSTQLGMLFYAFFLLFAAAAIIYGGHAKQQPWEKYPLPNKGSGVFFATSFVLSIAALLLSSYLLASLLVSKGIILQP